jgi:hypothetical protein
MSFINPIDITIGVGSQTVSRVGFGNPIIVGFTGSRSILISGSGQSEIVYKSVVRKAAVSVKVVIGTGFTYTDNSGTIEIELPAAGATVRELKADFDTNAGAPVKAIIDIVIGTSGLGLGAVSIIDPAEELTSLNFLDVVALSLLRYYYDETDTEYQMFVDKFNTAPNPQNKYLLDVFGAVDPSAAVQAVDTGAWWMLLTTSTVQSEQQELAEYIVTTKRAALFVSDDKADAEVFPNSRICYVIHDNPDDHPESAWAAKALPTLPGSITWAYLGPLAGQTPNTTSSLSDLLAVHAVKAQSYVLANGLQYMDEGFTTDDQRTTYIDQLRSRDWVELNLEADLLSLKVNSGGKIPYTNTGIQKNVAKIASRLEKAGENGIIREIETAEDALKSYGNKYVYYVNAPTRQEIKANNPEDIADRELNRVEFGWEESGAIHSFSGTGTVN